MRRNKKRDKIFLLLILLLGITVGFAALATTLKINGNATITKNTWSVYWEPTSVAVTQGSKGSTTPTVTNGTDGSINTKVTWSVNFELPGDFYEFTVDAANAGTLDAMINLITETTPQGLPNYISYSVKYDDGTTPRQYHILPKGTKSGNTITPTTEKYKVRIEFLDTITPTQMNAIPEDGLSYDFEYEVKYGQADEHAIPAHPTWNLPEGKNSNTLAVGDEICLAADSTQCFNFIRYDENNDVVMLAKWNLKVGNIYSSSGQKIGEYTSSDLGYGLQSSEARGYVQNETKYGTVPFSTDTYWVESFNLKPVYGSSYPADIYDEVNYKGNPDEQNYSVAYYVDKYKTLLTNKGATIKKARLLTYSEATDSSIGCSGSSYNCPTSGFIMNTSFWLGSSYNSYCLWTVYLNNSFSNYRWDSSDDIGVRPVIVVAKSNL